MSITLVFIVLILLILALYFISSGKTDSTRIENDAKRFAGLLVSEIKLYESYKLERGLRNNNLYESLHDEIEDARKKYKKRIPGKEFEQYFDNSLVEILADGDKSKLGLISTSLNK